MGFYRMSEVKRHYDLLETLGSGNFAIVKRATRLQPSSEVDIPEHVAIKIIDKAKVDDMLDIRREIDLLAGISHPNVITLYEIYDEPKKMHLVMELVYGGELFDQIVARGSYTEADASTAVKALCDALGYLHAQQVVHRNLKPENLLCEGHTLKIADVGLARVVSRGDMMKTTCGTPGYVAPEILENRGYDSGAVDMWSVGVILYILLCGFPPFYEEELPALFEQILHARYDFPFPWWDEFSQESKDLVRKLLELSPSRRLTASQARDGLGSIVGCGSHDTERVANPSSRQVLSHPWHRATRTTPLPETVKSLKKFNAARKLKRAALGVVAQERLAQSASESGFTPTAPS